MHLKLQPASPIPVYLQIVEQIRHGIAAGVLKADDELPSVRTLASQNLINPNTVARAYLELEREGFVSKRRGSGTYVSAHAAALGREHRLRLVAGLLDQALAAAEGFGLTEQQVRGLFEERWKCSVAESER